MSQVIKSPFTDHPAEGRDPWRRGPGPCGYILPSLHGASIRCCIVRRRVIALKTARAERVADALERSLGRGAMSVARGWLGRRGADRARRDARIHLVAT